MGVQINSVLHGFFITFPLFFDEKRYKLINFAPNFETVNKTCIVLIFKE